MMEDAPRQLEDEWGTWALVYDSDVHAFIEDRGSNLTANERSGISATIDNVVPHVPIEYQFVIAHVLYRAPSLNSPPGKSR